MEQQFFVASHWDARICKHSSSGGAFTGITDQWFAQYGDLAVVYGCVLDEELKAKHIRAANREERNRMRGSKYIGSDVSGIFRRVAEDFAEGKYIVFSGTPCQIAGLRSFLNTKGIETGERILTIEVVCHGVGSVKFFNDYIEHLEKRYKGKAVACNFRTKKRPGKKQDMTVVFDNGKVYYAASTRYDWFYSVYLKNLILRPSCFQCRFAQQDRVADISIADHWGDLLGERHTRSLIVVNTEHGADWVMLALKNMSFDEIVWEKVNQPHMMAPCEKPNDYTLFWEVYRNEGYLSAQRLIGNYTAVGLLRSIIVYVLDRMHLIEAAKYIRELCKK